MVHHLGLCGALLGWLLPPPRHRRRLAVFSLIAALALSHHHHPCCAKSANEKDGHHHAAHHHPHDGSVGSVDGDVPIIFLNARADLLLGDMRSSEWLCPHKCVVTTNASLQAKASMVYYNICRPGARGPPSTKPSHQTWVAGADYEGPGLSRGGADRAKALKGRVDYTITYRSDSDLVAPLVSTVPLPTPSERRMTSVAGEDTLMLWFVRNCGARKRLDIYHQMEKLLSKDERERTIVYGRCTDPARVDDCKTRMGMIKFNDTICDIDKIKRAKFYLAFENQECRDYLTEKLMKGYLGNAIPIVLGGLSRADVEKVVPASSFIHVEDFPSVEALVEHIRRLDQNDDEYLEYFAWQRRATVVHGYRVQQNYCKLCSILHNDSGLKPRGSEFDVYKWFYTGNCKGEFKGFTS